VALLQWEPTSGPVYYNQNIWLKGDGEFFIFLEAQLGSVGAQYYSRSHLGYAFTNPGPRVVSPVDLLSAQINLSNAPEVHLIYAGLSGIATSPV